MKTEIEKEMQLFENECKVLCYKGNMSRSNLGSFYNNEQTNWMYQMWLSSKNREGYKLVLVEPEFETMQNMNQALRDSVGETPKRKMQEIYKAMIGAVND